MTYATLPAVQCAETTHFGSLYDIRGGRTVDAHDGYELWSDRLDGDSDDEIADFFGGTVHIYSLGNTCDDRGAA